MKVGKSVTKAIDEWLAGDLESAMLHACNAIDGTARKQGFASQGNKARFLQLLRSNYDVLGPMGAPGVDLNSLFPVKIGASVGVVPMDVADVIYRVHRCTHGHGDELPNGFELIADAAGPVQLTRIAVTEGTVKLSDRMIFGLLAVAVGNPKNAAETAPDGYFLTFNGNQTLPVNDWWGRRNDMLALFAAVPMPQVNLDFGDWIP